MSEETFDPAVERAYRYVPSMADSALFEADVELRIYKRGARRRRILMASGLVLCVVGLSQIVRFDINTDFDLAKWANVELSPQLGQLDQAGRKLASNVGLGDVVMGSFQGAQLMVLLGIALALLLTGTAVRAAQSL